MLNMKGTFMKYLIINDEHELYRQMYADLFKTKEYNIEEIPRMDVPNKWKFLYNIHFSTRLNAHMLIPFKWIWDSYYNLGHYPFDDKEQYTVILLNGSVRVHYSIRFFKELKKKHPNIKLVLIMYDSVNHVRSKQTLKMLPLFDTIFSFDENDCQTYGFQRIYSTFSIPDFVKKDESLHSAAFFIGEGSDRTELLKSVFKRVTSAIDGCRFYITNINDNQTEVIKDVIYNQRMSYQEELQMAFNTECIFEIVRKGQCGNTLRTCEAVAFNKKLITNNIRLKEMPFYDSRYMKIFTSADDIDLNFIKQKIDVKYVNSDYFSPLIILKHLEQMNGSK